MAPAMPTTAEPSTKTWRWRRVTSLPIASAASRLSRIARIIRPQGDRSARSASQRMTSEHGGEEQRVAEARDDRGGGDRTSVPKRGGEVADPGRGLQHALVGDRAAAGR